MDSMQSAEDLANLQKLSNEYEPEIEGPLVGKRQLSQAITREYANADPVLVRKTEALPQKFSHYRTVKGDGNCGWRAIAFSYFETFLRLGDKNKILGEEARLKSLNNLLDTAGFQEFIYVDWVEETLKLLRSTADSLPVTDGGAALLDNFNNPDVSNAIIYHFRLLASAWMKTHADLYQEFILDATVEEYCCAQIERPNVEIEHNGLNALIEALIKPAGFALEILYLDRSDGEEANSIQFKPIFPDSPIIRLLYRPGHYDILYKVQDIASIISSAQMMETPQIALATSLNAHLPIRNVGLGSASSDLAPWLGIPYLSYAALPNGLSSNNNFSPNDLMPNDFVASPTPPIMQSFPSPSLPLSPVAGEHPSGSFRPSKYEYEPEFFPGSHNVPLQTATFRK
ncbi:MAG: hypothetical protein M1827_007336 [Pycnora praestabilis]|nr:MAG: hypothetical protein M1827_007336 [Pycnora praestabilis]